MHFGATLRMLRTEAGISLRSLGEQIGVSNAYLSRVENGHDTPPTAERVAAIARVLGVAPAALIELAHRVEPIVAGYLEKVPMAATLFLEIARRDVSTADLARVRAFVEAEFQERAASESNDRLLSELVGRSRIVTAVHCAALADAVELLAIRLGEGASARRIAAGLLAQDQACSSAIGAGVAIPHAVVHGAERRAAIAILARPLPHPTPDGAPLRLVVAVVHPRGGTELVRTLTQIARLANVGLASALREAPDVQRALEHFEAIYG